jgi:multidrug resistance efflux pump
MATAVNPSRCLEVLPPAVPKAQLKPDSRPSRWSFGRLLRISLGLFLLGAVGWMCYPWHWSVVSTHAVVNAPLVVVRAPIGGTVRMPCLSTGECVAADEDLLTITNPLVDCGRLEELKAEAATLAGQIAGMRQERDQLLILEDHLEGEARIFQEAIVQRMERDLAGTRALALSARAVFKQRDYERNTAWRLAGTGSAPDSERVVTEFVAEAAEQNAIHLEHNVKRLELEMAWARRSVFIGQGDGRNDVPYPNQRLHEVQMRRLSLDTRLAELTARLPQLERQIGAERERWDLATTRTVKMPRHGLVWHQQVDNGSHVSTNEELLQLIVPTEVFIDAVVPERCLRVIHAGDKVTIRRIGSAEETLGTVKAVLGRTMAWEERSLAASVQPLGPREAHVLVAFDERPDIVDFRTSLVGHPVEVLFGGPTAYLRQLLPGIVP